MEHDQRDRRDAPDADDASPPDSTQPPSTAEATGPDEPSDAPAPAAEPVDAPTEVHATAEDRPDDASTTPGDSGWPRQDASQPSAEEPPSPAWPTEPPAAGSAAADAWPTEAPEQGDEPLTEPDWGSRAEAEAAAPPGEAWTADESTERAMTPEPPPSEVEAYPAAPPAADPADATAAADAAAHTVPAAESATGESTQCPRCGTENRPGLAFCRSCGQRLVAAGVATTVERPSAPEGTMACPRCGTHNRAGVAFCQNCGANLRGTAPGYVPPAVAAEDVEAVAPAERGGAVLGPVVLLIGMVGVVTGYLLPFLYGSGSLFSRAMGPDGHGVAFWSAYPEVGAQLADQVYYGLTGPVPLFALLLLVLAIAGFMRARPGSLQTIGLGIALLWSVGLIILFVVVELAANWSGDIVGMLRVLTPAGIIFFLSSLIILIGTLTRFARS